MSEGDVSIAIGSTHLTAARRQLESARDALTGLPGAGVEVALALMEAAHGLIGAAEVRALLAAERRPHDEAANELVAFARSSGAGSSGGVARGRLIELADAVRAEGDAAERRHEGLLP